MAKISLRGVWLALRQTPLGACVSRNGPPLRRSLRRLRERVVAHHGIDFLILNYGPAARRVPGVLRQRAVRQERLAELPGVQSWRLGPTEDVVPQPPTMPRGEQANLLPLALRPRRLQAPAVAQVERAWLVGRHAVPFTQSGQMLLAPFLDRISVMGEDEHPDVLRWAQARGWQNQPRGDEAAWDEEDVCSLVGRLDSNFFHWMVDFCGQLEALEFYTQQTGTWPKILIRAASPAFVHQSLQVLGVDASRLLEWPLDWSPRPGEVDASQSEPVVARRVRRLVVPSWRGHYMGSSPRSMRWLRAAFLRGAGVAEPQASQPGRKIYLHRAAGNWRSVANGEEVCGFLHARGFEIVRPEALSVREQVALAASASVIVGMHGAALANILFAPRASLIELIGSYGGGDYLFMAQGLGNAYRRVRCEDRGEDIVVDLSKLGDAIESVA